MGVYNATDNINTAPNLQDMEQQLLSKQNPLQNKNKSSNNICDNCYISMR